MSVEACIGNGYSIDVEDYWRIQKHYRELRKENGVLKESLAREQSINAILIRRYETALSEASKLQLQSHKRIEDLERERENCSQEIGFLQDQLDQRNQEVSEKEAELQYMLMQMKNLESSVLSMQLESQCEIETLKHSITDFELRYLEVERFREHIANGKEGIKVLDTKLSTDILEEQKRVDFVETGNNNVTMKFALFGQYTKAVFFKVYDYLDKWLDRNQGHLYCNGEVDRSLTLSLSSELSSLGNICEYKFGEVVEPFLSKLAIILAWGESMNRKMQKMSAQIRDSEISLNQLKEELSIEKSRAKEEAEDLTQEMAELRYQITCLLEEECKRRSLIENASLQRIQELEEEVCKLKQKGLEAVKNPCEAHAFPKLRPVETEDKRKDLVIYRKATSKERCSHGSNVSCSSSHGSCSGVSVPLCRGSCDSWTSLVKQDRNAD